ncbi:MAG: four helix bundle protein [Candidatus Verstraetearchaeota archaeon]|nr:four helix bundle protein [Candidatus Verstraetearchaeota archaeon]
MADHTKAITWRDLEVWQRAHALVLKIYRLTAAFPQEEKFRLADQLCRAAISVPANIVEGQARQTTKEYLQFLYHARGSVEETRYHLFLARELGYLDSAKYDEMESEYQTVSKMLNGLIQSLKGREGMKGIRD